MNSYVLSFKEIKNNNLSKVGGKGLNLGELSKIAGIEVPDGFCVTTDAYKKAMDKNDELHDLIDTLSKTKAIERGQIVTLSESIRNIIEHFTIPLDVEEEITRALSKYENNQGFAIRSSATAEDLPHASFAGQQDTYLNIIGKKDILNHIVRCWASLFTDRAVTYRIQNGFDHRKVLLSVVIQKMILSEASGIMFTADPMTSDRKTLSIDAGFGLGEVLVSGLVNPDIYKIRDGKITGKTLGTQQFQLKPDQNGGVKEIQLGKEMKPNTVLSDSQILALALAGKKIEAHFGAPQDIEWCLVNNKFYIVQSRSITTLFPLPEVTSAKEPRVYMSIGHTQMMTDTIKPLGMSFFEMLTDSVMEKIGGRIYADITHDLSSAMGKNRLLLASGKQDPLIQNALKNLISDKQFMELLPKGKRNIKGGIFTFSSFKETYKIYKKNNPAIIKDLIQEFENEITVTKEHLDSLTGEEVLKFIKNDRKALYDMAYHPGMLGAIIAAILVNDSINKKVEKWLGIKNAADILTKSLDNNITTQMGLNLCDVADSIREYPEIYHFLSDNPTNDAFLDDIAMLPGGMTVRNEFMKFLRNSA
ncbi:PEP/pyruvate-binding domain-containing protein [Anaerocolumna sedimenticola]|uniref:PEP/pyruvate-binding domain-containing protein n=1 Tax=Anaerocolumna sedimenticola TaxID=2696063 RepID=UPI002ED62729